jgi:hypothetical protein
MQFACLQKRRPGQHPSAGMAHVFTTVPAYQSYPPNRQEDTQTYEG